MQKTDTKQRDPEAVLLARVYALILAWSEPEPTPTRADAANTRTPRNAQTRTKREAKANE